MRKELLVSVCALALVVGANNAFAGAYGDPVEPEEAPAAPPAPPAVMEEEEPDYARTGAYIGVGGNYAIEFFGGEGDGDLIGNSGGLKAFVGYRVHQNVAVQLRYDRYFGFDTDDRGAAGDFGGEYTAWALMADVKGYILTGRYQPYVIVGLGYIDFDSTNNRPVPDAGSGFGMRYGAGLDAHVTENIVMSPEVAWLQPYGDADDLAALTVGAALTYKF